MASFILSGYRSLVAGLMMIAGGLRAAAFADEVSKTLGAPDFHCTLERPFGWRGDGSGRFPGATPVTEWTATENVCWSTVAGSSYSSPVLTDKSVFVTSEPNLLICLDRTDGRERWKVALTPATIADPNVRKIIEEYAPPKDGSGMAAATPVTDGKNIYVLFANGLLCAVDLEGHTQWSVCIEAPQSTGYGRSASPIIVAGKLIVHMTNLYAFDPANGHQLWVNNDAKSSYGTPCACHVGDNDLILTSLGDLIQAKDGTSVNSDLGHTSHSSPIANGDQLYFADSEAKALKINAAFKEEQVWSGLVAGQVFSSPLLHDNLLFICGGEGDMTVFDATGNGSLDALIDGRPTFEGESKGPAAYGSLTLAGNYLFLNSTSGEVVVLEANRKAKLVSRHQMPKGTGSTPVFAGSKMFLRDGEKLWCIGK